MKRNLIKNPTITVLLLYVLSWLVGNGLLLYIMTDGFEVSPFEGKNLMFWIIVLFSRFATIKIVRNYFRTKNTDL